MSIKEWINKKLHFAGYHITSKSLFDKLLFDRNMHLLMKYAVRLKSPDINKAYQYSKMMKSQSVQDLVLLMLLNFKENGFFVEFGAVDGDYLSNTHLLEKRFNWKGILSEPAQSYHKQLRINRTCTIDTRCVAGVTGRMLSFIECKNGILSTLQGFKDSDEHRHIRKRKSTYKVESVTLNDLLIQHKAPLVIDFMSIDTEGSELEILENFFPTKYSVSIFVIEHNFTNNRSSINNLMVSNGYHRILDDVSYVDDWYVSSEIFERVINNYA
jgi:FkbM family methyltransferase